MFILLVYAVLLTLVTPAKANRADIEGIIVMIDVTAGYSLLSCEMSMYCLYMMYLYRHLNQYLIL